MTAPEDIYDKLLQVFSARSNQVLELEIISPALGSEILQDGLSIGLTKKALVKAYTVARQIFFKRLMFMSEDDFRSEHEHEPADAQGVTEIMLLFDCEHLSACNWRKRRLLAAIEYFLQEPKRDAGAKGVLEAELSLLTSYQTSPLHRHTKSPTLWSHRVWVLRQLLALGSCNPDAIITLQHQELVHALRAAELHPRNYYAFTYMRQLHALLTQANLKNQADWIVDLANSLLEYVLNWCFAHPRDISGWMFGKYLLDQISDQQTRSQATTRALVFARDIGWEGESLWTFIDQTTRDFGLESVIDEILPLQTEPSPSTQKQPAWSSRLTRAQAYWAASKHSS